MRVMATILPWVIPTVVVCAVLGLLVARPVARWLHTSPLLAYGIVVSLALVLGATIPPDAGGIAGPAPAMGACDLSRWWPASPGNYLRINEISLNVLLFVPLGLCVGMLPTPPSRRRVILLLALTPLLIEATQSLVPILGRGCQSGDVVDNLLGVAVGLCAGRGLAWLAGDRLHRRLVGSR